MLPTLTQLAERLPGGRLVLPDLITGGQIGSEDLAQLAAVGVRLIIDLRHVDEPRGFDEAALAADCGIPYVNLPTGYSEVPASHFDRIRDLLQDPEHRPALIHCASGNRVGGALIPYLVLDAGRTPDDAIELASEIGLRSPALARAAFEYLERRQDAP